jgi:hypothetical protein
MTILKTISMDEETAENFEFIRERLGCGYSQFVRDQINEKVRELTKPKKRMNKRMRIEELESQ